MPTTTPTTSSPTPRRPDGGYVPTTLPMLRAKAPNSLTAGNVANTFGLELPDFEGIADQTEEAIGLQAKTLAATLNEFALRIHLQRLVTAYIQSADIAAAFYSQKLSAARDETAKGANDHRDEDRDGVHGFESKAARARQFAAMLCMQAYALLAAAEGAATAYEAAVGTAWTPYVRETLPAASVGRKTSTAELDAFG